MEGAGRRGAMVTIRQIAEKCGCSTATVSKALNGAPDVSAETAERIRKTAAEMGYIANAAAWALKTSRSYSFGVLFEDNTNSGLTHEFFSRILNAFKRRSELLGYDISFISNRLGGREVSYTEHARYRNCDGVLILSVDFTRSDIIELATSGIPLVSIDYQFENCGCIQSDNVQGMKDLVTHIYQLGHRRIAFIHGEDTAVTRFRVASFFRTCKELGLEVPPEYVVGATYHDPAASANATKQLLSLKNRPSCIIYPDDISYIGGMNVIHEHGLRIPDDISVVGYDGIHLAKVMRLTTYSQNSAELGRLAAERLIRLIEHPKTTLVDRIMVRGGLLEGNSVKEI